MALSKFAHILFIHFFVSSFLIHFPHFLFPTQLCHALTSIALTLYCFSLFVHHADDDSSERQRINIADTDASELVS